MTTAATRSTLEEERDLLLRSLDDLDQEYAAGDLARDDYDVLRNGYTARAAAILRQLGGEESPVAPEADRKRSLAVAVVAALGVFAAIAGVLLARTAGERGVTDQLTGEIDASPRQQVLECQELGIQGDLLGSLECFDEVLATDPANAEALAYRGWYLVLATGALQQEAGGPISSAEADELVTSGRDYLDRAIEADPAYPDPLAFRAALADRLGDAEQVCADVAALLALDPPEFFLDQTAALTARNGCT